MANEEPTTYLSFCASLIKNATNSKQANNFDELMPLIKHASFSWVDHSANDFTKESLEIASKLGFSETLVNNLIKLSKDKHDRTTSRYEDLNSEMGLILPVIDVNNFDVKIDPLMILIKKDLILSIQSTKSLHLKQLYAYAESIIKKSKKEDLPTLLLIRIIAKNNRFNFEQVSEIEDSSDKISRELIDNSASRKILGVKIYHMKHALVKYLSGLWSTTSVLSSLDYGDAEVLSNNPKILEGITVQLEKVHTQISLAEDLSNVLASGLAVLQSIYNNQLQVINNRMTYMMGILTVIGTALLVPNTIATILSQTNIFLFTPADTGWYLSFLIFITVVATFISWWWVKKIGLLPNNPEQP
ncbi:MAG: CorA family divalent cation transporter [Candidatus Nanoarchaeia archaeon]|jgi:magnesium transporter